MIELRQLRYLIAAAEAGSFSRAARNLNIKQATLSRHILDVEKRLGMALFDRRTRGATLTKDGETYLYTAQRIVGEWEELNAWVRSTRNGEAGRLAVGFYTSFSAGNLRATLSEFGERNPNVKLRGFERDRKMLLAGIENGVLDIAIMIGESRCPGLVNRSFWSERIMVAMREDHRLAAVRKGLHHLLAGLPADDLLGQLAGATAWSWHAGEQQQLDKRFGGRCSFGVAPPQGVFDTAVLFLPKSRELTDYLLQTLAARLPGRPLYLVGEKRGGIERAAKQLGSFGRARKLDSARHCQLWQVEIEQAPAAPDLDALASHFTLQLADGPLEVVSLPGVFSHGRLDLGSALLLEHLDNLPGGRLLDFGCGAGILGATLKRRYPQSELVLLDVDAFAVESSRRTLAANGLEAEVIAGDGIDAAPRQLAAIISNPPFHQGVHTSYQASETLIERAAEHLQASGEMRIVANAFLRYPPLIERHLGACQTLAERDGFRIYRAVRG